MTEAVRVCSYCRNPLQPNRMCSACGRLTRDPKALAAGRKAKGAKPADPPPDIVAAKPTRRTRKPAKAKPSRKTHSKPVKGRAPKRGSATRLKKIKKAASKK